MPANNSIRANCKKPFYSHPQRTANGYGKYCSHACYMDYRKKQSGGMHACENCGKEIYVTHRDRAKGWGRFCSKPCRAETTKKLALEKAVAEGVSRTCPQCGKIWKLKYSLRKQRTSAYCTLECKHAHETTRFWSKVKKTESCWLWIGASAISGYGEFSAGGKSTLAHRYSYELKHGEGAANGWFVCHSCDNRPCVRPDHLFLGTHQDNMDDMAKKGRKRVVSRGLVLNPYTVREIRALYASGGLTYEQLANRFGVKAKAIERAVKGISWKDV